MSAKPSPGELWNQAGGDAQRYHDLMVEQGHLLRPGDEGYEDAPRNLACGWPGEALIPYDMGPDHFPSGRQFQDLIPRARRLVCSECLTEACFAGVLMCDSARTASVIELPALKPRR